MRPVLEKLRWVAALALAGLMAACGSQPGEVYPMAADDVRTRLQSVEVPMFVFGTAGAMQESPAAVLESPDRVSWRIASEGDELFRYVASIEPVDAGQTRVTVTLSPGNPRVEQGIKDNPDIAKIYVDAMVEAVDAGLEQREFRMTAITPATIAAARKRMGEINAQFDREIEEHRKKTQDNLDRAYEREGLKY